MYEIGKRTVVSVSAPHPEEGRYQGWMPCINWCEENLDGGWWFITEGVFEFDDPKDAMFFKLRWA